LTTFFLVIGLLFPWALVLAFLSLLPSIYHQLNHIARRERQSLKTALDSPSCDPASSSAPLEEIAQPDDPSSNRGETNLPPAPPSASKQRKPKKRLVKEEWGIPTLRVVDSNGKVIPVNPDTPTPMETDCFKGFILIMLKCDGEYADYDHYKHHFKGKQRKFEVQFQASAPPPPLRSHLSPLSCSLLT
jgi:hypothetical protein